MTGLSVKLALTMIAVAILACQAQAAEIGHFNGGVMGIRDYLVPDAGIYGAVYNYFYTTGTLNDSHGNKITSITLRPPGGGAGVTVGVDVNINMYVMVPAFIWVTDIEQLGIKYGALATPTFANVNLDAAVSAAFSHGGHITNGTFGVGDFFVQPVWLGKTLPHWDFAFSYGFYAPVGRYDTEIVTVPGIGPVKTESSDNVGYGFWTNQLQGATAWYPMDNKATAVVAALTYETNTEKRHFDLTPGDNLTLNWGVDQFLPLKEDLSLLLDGGLAGYDTWQITSDSGSDANDTRDQVHAIGAQLGLVYLPWTASLTLHGFYEYAADNRFQGGSFGINLTKKFW